MRILGIHTRHFHFEGKERATGAAEPLPPEKSRIEIDRECLVIFVSVEKEEEKSPGSVVTQLVADVRKRAGQLDVGTVVVYPYVHLTETPSTPRTALTVLKDIERRLSESLDVIRAPFGWYKAFDISCLGHPLSEWSGRYFPGDGAEAPDEEKAERKPSEFTRFIAVDLEGRAFDVTPSDFAKCPVFSRREPVYALLV